MISITSTAITISPALIAGEIVPVSLDATGMDLPASPRLYLAARAYPGPGWLLGACELEHGEGAAWTGSLNLATCPCSRWFFGAGADESRRILLELVEETSRDSLLRLATTLRNSALLGCADGTPAPLTPGVTLADVDAEIAAAIAQLSIPAPSDTAPAVDGTASPGASDAYARGDHVHPTDTSRVARTGDTGLAGDFATTGLMSASEVYAGGSALGTQALRVGPDNASHVAIDKDGVIVANDETTGTLIAIPGGKQASDPTNTMPVLATTNQIPSTPAEVGIAPETWTFAVDDGQGGTTTVTKSVCIVAPPSAQS